MSIENTESDQQGIHVRLATTADEVRAAQKLRYISFYEESSATPAPYMIAERRDFDDFDQYADHLIVVDPARADDNLGVVGTYRMLTNDGAKKAGRFYTSDEYDISCLLKSGERILEMGRSCVLEPYRSMSVLQLLWGGIARFISERQIDLMFGCACVTIGTTDPSDIAEELSLLYHNHLASPELRPRAISGRYTDMNLIARDKLDARRVFMKFPPLIKGYLRVGAMVGDGAVIDHHFNSIDVCIIMPTYMITDRYVKHYEIEVNNGPKAPIQPSAGQGDDE
jgi:putative hemolysin